MALKVLHKIPDICKKYKFAILILLIGLVLMMFPAKTAENTDVAIQKNSQETQVPLEDRLASILCQVEGAGNVEVVLTISAGEEILFQTDEDSTHAEKDQSIRSDTVITTDSDRNETGLIRQVIPAVYQGAIVVCDGADNPSVRLAIVDAVSKLTGLGANCICVLKMK